MHGAQSLDLESTDDLPSRLRIAEAVVSQSLAEETVVLNLKTGRYHGLNATAGRVWRLIESGLSVSAILEVMVGEFDVEPETLQRDTQHLLESFLIRGLVEADSNS